MSTNNPAAESPFDPLAMSGFGRKLIGNLTKNWWVLLLRGLVAIAFGILTLAWPGLTLFTLVLLFGAYALVDGILTFWSGITGRPAGTDHRWALVLWGIVGILAGVATFTAPGFVALWLLVFIAVWAVAKGIIEILAATHLRKEIQGEWLLVIGGLASIAFGVILFARPGVGALALAWLIGLYALFFGFVLVLLSFHVHSLANRFGTQKPQPAH